MIRHSVNPRRSRKSWIGVLSIFLAPITVVSISVNYTFLTLYFFNDKVRNPARLPPEHVLLALWAIIVFSAGVVANYNQSGDYGRQLLSFGAFLSMALLLWLPLPFSRDELCKAAVLVSSVYAAWAIFNLFFVSDVSVADPFAVKARLRLYVTDWPQRFSVLMVFALFVSAGWVVRSKLMAISFICILTCLVITFTRATYISIFVGSVALLFSLAVRRRAIAFGEQDFRSRHARGGAIILLMLIAGGGVIAAKSGVLAAIEAIVSHAEGAIRSVVMGDSNEVSSTGKRIAIWSDIVEFVLENPVHGSGFEGYYLMDSREVDVGSAHSQYMDVLLRTGFVGLILYLLFWLRLLSNTVFHYPFVFAGLTAVFVYGIVHETTKLSYVGFLVFSMANLVSQETRVALSQNRKKFGGSRETKWG